MAPQKRDCIIALIGLTVLGLVSAYILIHGRPSWMLREPNQIVKDKFGLE